MTKQICKRHINALEMIADGADVYDYAIAKALRELYTIDPSLLVMLTVKELEELHQEKFNPVEKLPYFGAAATDKGLELIKTWEKEHFTMAERLAMKHIEYGADIYSQHLAALINKIHEKDNSLIIIIPVNQTAQLSFEGFKVPIPLMTARLTENGRSKLVDLNDLKEAFKI